MPAVALQAFHFDGVSAVRTHIIQGGQGLFTAVGGHHDRGKTGKGLAACCLGGGGEAEGGALGSHGTGSHSQSGHRVGGGKFGAFLDGEAVEQKTV